jgi:hypothetical protein
MSEPATIAAALRILARDIHCEDGVATLCLHEAANEIDRLAAEMERLRMTDKERDAMEFFADLPWAKESDNAVEAEAIRGFLARHARETVGE